MEKAERDKHYEDKFEFPLLKMIMQRAEEKDISYSQAADEVLPEWGKGIRYRDTAFEEAAIQKRQKELAELIVWKRKRKKIKGVKDGIR